MAVIDREEALARADQIRDETAEHANTATRVGQLVHDIAESMAFGAAVVPPISTVWKVDGETDVLTGRDGGEATPYISAVEAIADHPADETGNQIVKLLVAPQDYTGDLTLTASQSAELSIAAMAPGAPTLDPVLLDGDITLTGSEGATYLTLQDVEHVAGTITSMFVDLIRSNVVDPIAATRIRLRDNYSTIANPANPTVIELEKISHVDAFSADSATFNPFPSNFRFAGPHLFTLYLEITTPAAVGTLDVSVEWTDDTGAKSRQVITALDVTSGGDGYETVTLMLEMVNPSIVTYSLTFAALSGVPVINIRAALISLDRIAT